MTRTLLGRRAKARAGGSCAPLGSPKSSVPSGQARVPYFEGWRYPVCHVTSVGPARWSTQHRVNAPRIFGAVWHRTHRAVAAPEKRERHAETTADVVTGLLSARHRYASEGLRTMPEPIPAPAPACSRRPHRICPRPIDVGMGISPRLTIAGSCSCAQKCLAHPPSRCAQPYQWACHVHGSMTATPAAANAWVSRVATSNPWVAAIAAM
jgi:hypothetical protein